MGLFGPKTPEEYYRKGMKLWNNRAESLKYLKVAADGGHEKAFRDYAERLIDGGDVKDLEEALSWLELCFWYGEFQPYFQTWRKLNQLSGKEWDEEVMDHLIHNLIPTLEPDRIYLAEREESVTYRQAAAEVGRVEAILEYAQKDVWGLKEKAEWYWKYFEANGERLEDLKPWLDWCDGGFKGTHVSWDEATLDAFLQKGLPKLEEKAKAGDARAKYDLGRFYDRSWFMGHYVKNVAPRDVRNGEKAVYWYEQFILNAEMLEDEEWTEKTFSACEGIANLCLWEELIPQNFEKAYRYLRACAAAAPGDSPETSIWLYKNLVYSAYKMGDMQTADHGFPILLDAEESIDIKDYNIAVELHNDYVDEVMSKRHERFYRSEIDVMMNRIEMYNEIVEEKSRDLDARRAERKERYSQGLEKQVAEWDAQAAKNRAARLQREAQQTAGGKTQTKT